MTWNIKREIQVKEKREKVSLNCILRISHEKSRIPILEISLKSKQNKKSLGDSKLFRNEKHQTSHRQHLRLEDGTSHSTDEMTTQPRYNLHVMVEIYVKIQSLKYIGR